MAGGAGPITTDQMHRLIKIPACQFGFESDEQWFQKVAADFIGGGALFALSTFLSGFLMNVVGERLRAASLGVSRLSILVGVAVTIATGSATAYLGRANTYAGVWAVFVMIWAATITRWAIYSGLSAVRWVRVGFNAPRH